MIFNIIYLICNNIFDNIIKCITTLRIKSNLVLHVPRSGRGLLLLVVEHVRFNAVLPLSGFSGSVTSGSRDVSVMFVKTNGNLNVLCSCTYSS